MKVPIEKHIEFYNLEIVTIKAKWKNYLNKEMRLLIAENELYIGRLWAVEKKTGLYIIRFKAKEVPRSNTPYFLGLVGTDAVGNPNSWNFSYHDFRLSSEKNYWTKKGGDITVLNYLKADNDWAYFLISIPDLKFGEYLEREFLENDLQPLVVIAESDPPLEYLYNLKEFIELNKENLILNSACNIQPKNWQPKGLDNENDITETLLKIINENKTNIIQGPPGTGKSYYASKIIKHFIDNNQTVAVCALTNKALMEVIGQPALRESLKNGLVYKTSLSKEEIKKEPQLKSLEDATLKQGELLATTFYKLSNYYKDLISDSKRFDLLIIEEASQAFLATIAMFHKIADKVLIVGDHKQLPPVVNTNKKILDKIHPYIETTIRGLESFAFNNNNTSYRLTKTKRLTNEAANLTGLFYDNQLKSISSFNNKIIHPTLCKEIFHPNGGISIVKLDKAGKKSRPEDTVLHTISKIAKNVLDSNTKAKVAILVPTKNHEKRLNYKFSQQGADFKRITISTVHKVQGITCDYTLFYLPLTNFFLELDDNLFNVATSRAKKGCLLVTYSHIDEIVGKSIEYDKFINGCIDVTESYKNLFYM